MTKRVKRYTLYILYSLFALTAMASGESRYDSVRVSLLTCSPGEEVYELFGHTAIRYQNFSQGYDVVFNYGVFNFNEPNFVLRFACGDTDYMLGVVPFDQFKFVYESRGSEVREQQLNLSPKESNDLGNQLWENFQPKYRVYRYNYFYDNCTTRARDRIENALEGEVVYTYDFGEHTYRDWVKLYTKGHPWADFGINLCLGSEADRPMEDRQQMFLPDNLMSAFDEAEVQRNPDEVRKLVKTNEVLIPASPKEEVSNLFFLFTPLAVALLLLAAVVGSTWWEWKHLRIMWWVDVFLYTLFGLAGCIITFLFFFSSHPTVGSNWLIILFNPLPLVCLPAVLHCIKERQICWYEVVNFAVLTLFIAFFALIPQKISFVVVPLALILLLRFALHIVIAYVKRHYYRKSYS